MQKDAICHFVSKDNSFKIFEVSVRNLKILEAFDYTDDGKPML